MTRFALYRDESGNSDWAITAQSDVLQIRTGKIDSKLKLTEIPVTKCVANSPVQEMDRRIHDLLSDPGNDFHYLDYADLNQDGKVTSFSDLRLSETIYWNASFVNTVAEVKTVLINTANDLKSAFPQYNVVVSNELIKVSNYKISFINPGANFIDFDLGQGTGLLNLSDGILPALWLMYISSILKSRFEITATGIDGRGSYYLQQIGYFRKNEVSRFRDFAKNMGFLSVEAQMLSKISDFEVDFDYL